MKGQFFVMATVIMIYTFMSLIQCIYDFSDVNLLQLKRLSEIYYIQYIKDSLNKTVISSSLSQDCNKVEIDVNSTEKLLRDSMIARGINLTISHNVVCPSYVNFNFSLRTPELSTFTEFRSP